MYNQKGDLEYQAQLWQKSIQINKTMGIPTEKDENDLEELKKRLT
jgi:hypothetical protein